MYNKNDNRPRLSEIFSPLAFVLKSEINTKTTVKASDNSNICLD